MAVSPTISIVGGLTDFSGYADEARGFLRALESAGYAPGAYDIQWSEQRTVVSPAEAETLRRQIARGAEHASVVMHHYPPHAGNPHVDLRANVSRTMFETDRIPAQWLDLLLARDQVWVPCDFNVETFERGGVPASRLRVLGGTLDFDLFAPGAEPLDLGVDPARQVFLSNFEFQERKGWRQLLEAWARAFTADDPVVLVLKVAMAVEREAGLVERVDAVLADAARRLGRPTAPVKVFMSSLPVVDMPRLYAAADAYVLPTRGEGWGRPFMEALAMGLPTVASNWGGQLEFMDPATSWLVDGRTVPVAGPDGTFGDVAAGNRWLALLDPGHRWFEADVDALAAALCDIARDPAAARDRASGARADLIERFGPAAVAARAIELAAEAEELYRHRHSGPKLCITRGRYGSADSLAITNDGLTHALENAGHVVLRRGPEAEAMRRPEPSVSLGWPPDFTPGSAGPALVILPWEYGDPPREWVQAAREQVDRVIAPSAYVRDGFVAAGMPAGVVDVVMLGVDLERFTPSGPARALPRQAGTTFLFVGGTIARKGIDVLVDAWMAAFDAGDDVQLVIKDAGSGTHYAGVADRLRELAAGGTCAPITVIDDHLEPDDLAALYRAADVLVAPYRAEGFCLPALEALACGLPVIHTAEGPTREFVPPTAGWAVAAHREELGGTVDDGRVELAGPGYWHTPDAAALTAALRSAADPHERRTRAAAARPAAERMSWGHAAAQLERVLAEVDREALLPIRHVRPVDVPDTRGTTVVHVADWSADAWEDVLAAWATSVPADADVSLVLPVPPDRDAEIVARVQAVLAARGLDPEALPDIALARHDDESPAGLVAAADAVLLDAVQAAERPAALVRRAARVLTVDELSAFAGPATPALAAA